MPQIGYRKQQCAPVSLFLSRMLQESKHDGLYDDWNSNCRPFESFMAVIKGGNSVLCKWFGVFFSISDQVSAYEKLRKEVPQKLT